MPPGVCLSYVLILATWARPADRLTPDSGATAATTLWSDFSAIAHWGQLLRPSQTSRSQRCGTFLLGSGVRGARWGPGLCQEKFCAVKHSAHGFTGSLSPELRGLGLG